MNSNITIHIFYTGREGSARDFAREMTDSGLVERIRAEEGNLGYAYYYPAEDPETVLLIDRWRDQASIDVHHKSEMMGAIAELRKKYHLKMRVERFRDAD